MRSKPLLSIATFAVFLSVVAVFVAYIASLGIRISPPADRTNLSMDVGSINNLVVDASVLLRGVRVGKVTGIDASTSNATVHFYVEGQYQIPEDSDVRLENLSALGESYIELEPLSSGGPLLRDGQRLAIGAVKESPSVSELGVSVVRVLNQMDPQQLDNVINEVDVGLPDPAAVLPNLARTSMLLRNTTADLNGQGRAMLRNFQALLENAGFVGPALAEAAPSIRALGTRINTVFNDGYNQVLMGFNPGDVLTFAGFIGRIQKFLDNRGVDLRILGEATSANVKLIAAAIRNLDSSQILANLIATVPEDGAINLHVTVPQG
ncbi:MlaD family protein [Mycolicibacterium sp. P9-22]|uniref:MlaD family protein n=1 Tax=Mycolicibacterium sp. P9-22 TaxID=2024613 RepID=UPI0011EE016E|nr:MlaD family protein [Mycolicibacterium sp. P9-22]KAA0110010.1 MCE family protein [Mycolicibacterium sp. P9-22]